MGSPTLPRIFSDVRLYLTETCDRQLDRHADMPRSWLAHWHCQRSSATFACTSHSKTLKDDCHVCANNQNNVKASGGQVTVYSSLQPASLLWELTRHMGPHRVIGHPAEVIFPTLPQPKLVLNLAAQMDARLSWPSWLVTYKDDIPACKQTPIPVLTGSNVR